MCINLTIYLGLKCLVASVTNIQNTDLTTKQSISSKLDYF